MARTETETTTMRLDKWLWCARFYKTRAIAVEAIDKGHVKVNAANAKPAKEIQVGDTIHLQQAGISKTVKVNALTSTRGSAPLAQLFYTETPDSINLRNTYAEQRHLTPEPSSTLKAGRPTKKYRRDLQNLRDWNERWSAYSTES